MRIGSTRLGRIERAGGKQLKNFLVKVFLLLLGFYTANALARILGQTGDWDVLVAGIVVAAIEGIGMVMYKKPPPPYWKAGVCLGLFAVTCTRIPRPGSDTIKPHMTTTSNL